MTHRANAASSSTIRMLASWTAPTPPAPAEILTTASPMDPASNSFSRVPPNSDRHQVARSLADIWTEVFQVSGQLDPESVSILTPHRLRSPTNPRNHRHCLTKLTKKVRAPRTIEVYIRRLDAMMRRAEDERRMERNPVNACRSEIPSAQRTPKRPALEREEAWRLIEAASVYDSGRVNISPLASLLLRAALHYVHSRGVLSR